MVNLNVSFASLNVTSLSVFQGMKSADGQINNQISGLGNNADKFREMVANLLTGAEKSALETEKVNLGSEIINNDKLQSAVYKAASILLITGEIQTTAIQSTSEIAQSPAIKSFIEAAGLTESETTIFVRSIKVSAIEISIREIAAKNTSNQAAFNTANNSNIPGSILSFNPESIMSGLVTPGSLFNPTASQASQSVLPSNAEPTLVGNNSANASLNGILNTVSEAASTIQSIGKEIALATTEVSPQEGQQIAVKLNNVILALKQAIIDFVEDRFDLMKEQIGTEKTAQSIKNEVTAIQQATDNIINKANALINQFAPVLPGVPVVQSQTPELTTKTVPATTVPATTVPATTVPAATVPATTPIATTPVTTSAETPITVSAQEVAQNINSIVRELNTVAVTVEAMSYSYVAAMAAFNVSAPNINPAVQNGEASIQSQLAFQSSSVNIETVSINAQFSGAQQQQYEVAQNATSEVKDTIIKIVNLLNELNGKLEVSNRVEVNFGTNTQAADAKASATGLNSGSIIIPDAVIQQKVFITPQQVQVAPATVTNAPAKAVEVANTATPQKEVLIPVDTKSAMPVDTTTNKGAIIDMAKNVAVNPAGDKVQALTEQLYSSSTQFKANTEAKLLSDIEWLTNNIAFDVKSAEHLQMISNKAVFENIAFTANSVREQLVIRQVTQGIINSSQTIQTTEIKMVLQPENLGNVFVKLEMHDKVITGKITVMNADVKEILKASVVELKAALVEAGIEVDSFTVSLASDDSGYNFDGNTNQFDEWSGGVVSESIDSNAFNSMAAYANNNGYLNYFA